MSNLVWHDEQDVSWTYCGRFWVIHPPSGNIQLYRNHSESITMSLIGTFHSVLTAQAIAEIIMDAESWTLMSISTGNPRSFQNQRYRKPKKLPESKTLTYEQLIELESKYPPLAGGR